MTETVGPRAIRPRPMRLQKVNNRITRAMLATPGVSGGIGRALLTVYVTGRKTGKRYCSKSLIP